MSKYTLACILVLLTTLTTITNSLPISPPDVQVQTAAPASPGIALAEPSMTLCKPQPTTIHAPKPTPPPTVEVPFSVVSLFAKLCAQSHLHLVNGQPTEAEDFLPCDLHKEIMGPRSDRLIHEATQAAKIKDILIGFGNLNLDTFYMMLDKLSWSTPWSKVAEQQEVIDELYALANGRQTKPLSAKALAMQRMATHYILLQYAPQPPKSTIEEQEIKDYADFERITAEAAMRAEAEAAEGKVNPRSKTEADRMLEQYYSGLKQQQV